MAYLNQRCRSKEAAQAALGAVVVEHGVKYRCVDHNDLGVLYWQPYGSHGKPKGKLIYDRRLDYLAGYPGAY